jgi:hypothetical protein
MRRRVIYRIQPKPRITATSTAGSESARKGGWSTLPRGGCPVRYVLCIPEFGTVFVLVSGISKNGAGRDPIVPDLRENLGGEQRERRKEDMRLTTSVTACICAHP